MDTEQEYIEQVNDMVSYQKNAIVSKIITDKETGRITMFAFSKGQGISEQLLPFDSILFITDGKVELVMENKTTILKKDNVLFVPKNISHEIFGIENFKMLSIIIEDKND